MRALIGDAVIAESDRTIVVEGNHYFPLESVREGTLEPSRSRSLCPWKGVASYFHVHAGAAGVGDERARNAAWTYRHPYPWIRRIRGHVAFWGPVEVRP